LKGVRLVISDAHEGLKQAIGTVREDVFGGLLEDGSGAREARAQATQVGSPQANNLAAWDAGLRTSSAWHSRRSFREPPSADGKRAERVEHLSARCRRESPTWQNDIVNTLSRR
jgi:hypothetical protein